MPPLGDAYNLVQPAYLQAEQALQTQTPAIQNLYASLLQGLQAQAGTQTQNVVASAQRRGVGRAGLGGDVQAQLGQELALQSGQLGYQQAQDLTGVQQAIGKLKTERVGRISDLAQSLQEGALNQRKSQGERDLLERGAQLKMLQSDRDFEVSRISAERAAAQQAAAAQRRAGSKAPETSQALLTVGGLWQPGKDGYVNPKQWNELRRAFMEAGYSGSAFASEFGNLINPEHVYRDSKLPRYQGVKIKD